MKIVDTPISGLKIIEPVIFEDMRGKFIKTFSIDILKEVIPNIEIKECYYSISHKNVIRGMHFQKPPYEYIKFVYVPKGKILDVVLDMRKNSPTFGKSYAIELSEKNGKVLVIPKGLAHGFKSLENNTNVSYMQSSVYSPQSDDGVSYDSFGFDWSCDEAKLSQRDLSFKPFQEYHTPFNFKEYR